jgi:hypothetical protein
MKKNISKLSISYFLVTLRDAISSLFLPRIKIRSYFLFPLRGIIEVNDLGRSNALLDDIGF